MEPGRSGTGKTSIKWLIWENELGAGERLLVQAICVLLVIYSFLLGQKCTICVPHSRGKLLGLVDNSLTTFSGLHIALPEALSAEGGG